MTTAPTVEAAYEMGAKGGIASDDERLAFEAWIRGHCWTLGVAEWDGKEYKGNTERSGILCQDGIMARKLWAAWRDRAALSS